MNVISFQLKTRNLSLINPKISTAKVIVRKKSKFKVIIKSKAVDKSREKYRKINTTFQELIL